VIEFWKRLRAVTKKQMKRRAMIFVTNAVKLFLLCISLRS
jgi:hypothetical protein